MPDRRSGLLDFFTGDTNDDLTYRSSMLPIGTYRGSDGRERAGLAWPQLALDAVDAMEAPGELLFGEGLDRDESQRRASIAAGLMMGGGLAAPRPGNALAKPALQVTREAPLAYASKNIGTKSPFVDGADYIPSAVKIGEDYYVAPTHLMATEKILNRFGDANADKLFDTASDGFMFGNRFFTRDETADLTGSGYIGSENGLDLLGLRNSVTINRSLGVDVPADRIFSNRSKGGAGVGIAEATANALPMDQASRMARAREMGFDTDTTWYHGTSAQFDAFDPSKVRDHSIPSIWHTSSPEAASYFANINKDGPPSVMQNKVRNGNQLKVPGPRPFGGDAFDSILKKAQSDGYDSVRFGQVIDDGTVSDQLVILDPRNIRSVNAAFDPAKSDSANLLAANASPSTGLLVNSLYANEGPYQTFLGPRDEGEFRNWVSENGVPFQPNETEQDYDMRGYWQARQSGDPRARSEVNHSDQRTHYPDIWKTPSHRTFSSDSQYANPMAPRWIDGKLIGPNGRIIADEMTPYTGLDEYDPFLNY